MYSKVIKLYIHLFFSNYFPIRFSQNIQQSSLCYTVGTCWLSILNIIMCTCQFQFPTFLMKKTFKIYSPSYCTSCIQFSRLVFSDFLWPPWTTACQASLSITNSWSLLKLMSFKLVMPSNHLILSCPLLLLLSVFCSIRVFHKKSVHIRWPKYWCFSFSMYTRQYY